MYPAPGARFRPFLTTGLPDPRIQGHPPPPGSIRSRPTVRGAASIAFGSNARFKPKAGNHPLTQPHLGCISNDAPSGGQDECDAVDDGDMAGLLLGLGSAPDHLV